MDIIIIVGAVFATLVGLAIVGVGITAAIFDRALQQSKNIIDNPPSL